MKSAITLQSDNIMTSKNYTTLSNFCLLLVIWYNFFAIKSVNILILPSLKFDDVSVTLPLIALSSTFLVMYLDKP